MRSSWTSRGEEAKQALLQQAVLTKGLIELSVSELGLVTPGGKVVWESTRR